MIRPVQWTVLIVDDHPEYRSVARAVLDAEGFRYVGEAADGTSAIDAAERLHPDVVLLDIQLPDLDGFAVAERLAAGPRPVPAIVFVSSRSARAYQRRLADSVALGFISKSDLSGAALSELLAQA